MSQTGINYADFVMTLAKPGEDIVATLTGEQAHILHMAVGVSGEAGELAAALQLINSPEFDRGNVIEEVGDLYFYLTGLLTAIKLAMPSECHGQDGLAGAAIVSVELQVAASELLDAVKKAAIYQKPLDKGTVSAAVDRLVYYMNDTQCGLGFSRKDAIAANVAKLQARYHSGSYSDTQAQERADKQE